MAVSGSDLHWYLSSSGASEGGAKSATEITNGVDNNVFPDIGTVSLAAGGSVKRKIFLTNQNGVEAYLPHSIWIFAPPTGCTSWIALGFNDADDDDSALGTFLDLSANARIALVSNGADTRSVDVWGYDGAGDPIKETVTMNGTTEVLTTATFSSYLAIHTTTDGARTITAKQGSGGSSLGTIAPNAVVLFRWLVAASKSTGVKVGNLPTGQSNGIWERRDHAAGAPAGDGRNFGIKVEKL